MKRPFLFSIYILALAGCSGVSIPRMADIHPGSFVMGSENPSMADADEAPAHRVNITNAFRISVTEITNAEYEQFRPAHRALREEGFSCADGDAVVNVTWDDAVAYCKWLSRKTGRHFRLPTEAEWEYCCRAGTTGSFWFGEEFPQSQHKHQVIERNLVPVSLDARGSVPNPFGLYCVHGNVEEWCMDWYGPYSEGEQTDPAGPESGLYRVTRGGSHNTEVEFLRSASRSAALPSDMHNQIGFRIVESRARLDYSEAHVPHRREVSQDCFQWPEPVEDAFWMEPVPFVVAPLDDTPFYRHNHQPAVCWCDNGDLLAIWFSCDREGAREMVVLSSRLRPGAGEWTPAELFFKVPDRNMTGSSLLRLADGTLIHMNGVGNSGDWQNLALCARRSNDNGASWSEPVLVEPEHECGHQVISGPVVLSDGSIIQLCDARAEGDGGTAVHRSTDEGRSWTRLEGRIAGIHASVVERKDGSLLAFGRGDAVDGRMPKSVSRDGGRSWEVSASCFPPVGSGQRHRLIRLAEGPLMLCSFGESGLFVSISEDEGESWSEPKLMSDGNVRTLDGGAHTKTFTMDAKHSEPKGYLDVIQTPDGTIHLLSSRLHYRFNLQWIRK